MGRLKVAAADARRMRDALVGAAGFSPDRVILLTDDGLETAGTGDPEARPTYTVLWGRVASFCQEHKSTDVLMIYFAGHGFHSKALKRDYLAPLDVKRSALDRTALAVDDVLDLLKGSGARQGVLIADACRNAVGRAAGGEDVGVGDSSLAAAQARGVWYLTSCSPGQTSQEDPALGGGLYTLFFTEGLAGAADGQKDGYVTVREAQAYAEEKVEGRTRALGVVQTPCRSELNVSGGEMVLAVCKAAPPAAPPAGAPTPPAVQPAVAPAQPAAETPAPERAAVPPPGQTGKPWEQEGTHAGQEIVGPDGGTCVWVPAGEFAMGSPAGEGEPNEHPAHRVRLTKGFRLGKCHVTNGQYKRYCQETGVTFPLSLRDLGDNYPVTDMSWLEAAAYCKCYGLSLPTEAQWEYAARGPEGLRYPWGDEWDPKKCCNVGNQGTLGMAFAVGSFPAGASWCGARDMAGNAWEWCADRYDKAYYERTPVDDPPGAAEDGWKVLRGGSSNDGEPACRTALRSPQEPSFHHLRCGFRACKNP